MKPDHEPHIERMIDRADYLRTERKDREWEEGQAIKLTPARSDYRTFAETTARAMGKPKPAEDDRPNERLLSMLGLGLTNQSYSDKG